MIVSVLFLANNGDDTVHCGTARARAMIGRFFVRTVRTMAGELNGRTAACFYVIVRAERHVHNMFIECSCVALRGYSGAWARPGDAGSEETLGVAIGESGVGHVSRHCTKTCVQNFALYILKS